MEESRKEEKPANTAFTPADHVNLSVSTSDEWSSSAKAGQPGRRAKRYKGVFKSKRALCEEIAAVLIDGHAAAIGFEP